MRHIEAPMPTGFRSFDPHDLAGAARLSGAGCVLQFSERRSKPMNGLSKARTNQINALKSTGPRTVAGKAIVALNAVKHGLLARETVLRGESKRAFRALADGLWCDLRPVGALENLLVDRVVAAAWRLRRLHAIEAGLFESKRDAYDPESLARCFNSDSMNVQAFPKLSRYEAAIERGLFRALHELERQQARRSGGYVLPPVAVDVDVSVEVNEGEQEAPFPAPEMGVDCL